MTSLRWGTGRLVVAVVVVTGTVAMGVGVILGHFVIPPADGESRTGGNLDARSTPSPALPSLVAAPTETAGPPAADEPAAVGQPAPIGETFPGAPTRINEFGVPVGYPRTEAGAISACGNYVSAYTRAENREPSRIKEVFRSFSLASESEELSRRITDADSETARNFGVQSINAPEMNFSLRAVGFKVDSFNLEEATVSVWAVGAVGIYDGPPNLLPQEHWGTDICTIRWAGDDWKLLRAASGSDGPAPTERSASAFQRYLLLGGAR